jgi:hypothetical protein
VAWKLTTPRRITFHRISRHVEPFVPRSRNEAHLSSAFLNFFGKRERESPLSHPFALNEGLVQA